jgi:hypothetical protein
MASRATSSTSGPFMVSFSDTKFIVARLVRG